MTSREEDHDARKRESIKNNERIYTQALSELAIYRSIRKCSEYQTRKHYGKGIYYIEARAHKEVFLMGS